MRCYFATPYHSWERGSNENFNGLVRQYIPKGVSMRNLTQADCNAIAFKLNSRPRKRFGYRTPLEIYHTELAKCCTSTLNLSASSKGVKPPTSERFLLDPNSQGCRDEEQTCPLESEAAR